MIFRSLCAFALSVALAGCTNELTVTPHPLDTSANPIEEPLKGIPYYLPATALDVSVTQTITGCQVIDGQPKLTVVAATEIKPVRVADRSTAFVIDYTSLQSAMKHSTIKVTRNADGTLSRINADSEDLTGDTVLALVKAAAAGIGLAALPRGFLPEDFGVTRGEDACAPMRTAIEKRNRLNSEIQTNTKRINALLGKSGGLTDAEKTELSQLQREVKADKAALVPLVEATSLTLEETVQPERDRRDPTPAKSPEDPGRENGAYNETTQKICAQQGNVPLNPAPAAVERLAFTEPSTRQQAGRQLSACLRVTPEHPLHPAPSAAEMGSHLVYREPGPAAVALRCTDCLVNEATDPTLLFNDTMELAQFGLHYKLPFKNKAFDDNVLTANFDERGFLENATYESEAGLKEAALLAQRSAETLEERAKSRLSDDVAEAKDRNELLKAQIERMELQAQLKAAQGEPGGS